MLTALMYDHNASNIFATLEAVKKYPELAERTKYKKQHLHKFANDPEVKELLKQTGGNPIEQYVVNDNDLSHKVSEQIGHIRRKNPIEALQQLVTTENTKLA